MRDNASYWTEAVESSLEEQGIVATTLQIKNIADDMSVSHDQYDMAFGDDVASRNFSASQQDEVDTLKRELAEERDKTTCKECNGKGHIIENGPYHSSESECAKCRGNGRL